MKAAALVVLWLVPTIDRAWGGECLAGMRVANVLRVDNSLHNLGVARSWNVGIDAARGIDADWLVLCSESVRFGPAGGLDFEASLSGYCTLSHLSGWHLIALHRDLIGRVGYFDPTFGPAYFEDADYSRRMTLAGQPINGGEPACRQIEVDAAEQAVAHTLTAGLVEVDYGAQAAKYDAKWGGPPGAETFDRPWNRPDADLTTLGA